MWNINLGFNNLFCAFGGFGGFGLFGGLGCFNSFCGISPFFNYGPLLNFGGTGTYSYTNYGTSNYGSAYTNYSNPYESRSENQNEYVNKVDQINHIENNKDRIIAYNKKNYNKKYYGIVDKKNCQLTIYDKSGKAVKSYKLGIGKEEGDGLTAKHTTAGEFTLDETDNPQTMISDYKNYVSGDQFKFMALRGDNVGKDMYTDGIHIVPKTSEKESREQSIKSEDLEDNRMSLGCINMLEEDYDDMYQKYLHEGCKIYVLPEEDGNELRLTRHADGTCKFEQTAHKDDERGRSAKEASKVNYDA